jgi:hypothetical protein
MIKMFIVSFLNTGVIIFIVNLNLGFYIKWFPAFSGSYDEFTVEWYRVVGSTIILTMIINIVSPHFSNLCFTLMNKMSLCCDRKCTCDPRRTRKIL